MVAPPTQTMPIRYHNRVGADGTARPERSWVQVPQVRRGPRPGRRGRRPAGFGMGKRACGSRHCTTRCPSPISGIDASLARVGRREASGSGVVIGVGLDIAMTVLDVAGRLPGIAELREHCRALAILEAIISPDWESRYYSFNSAWAAGQQVASMRDGSGNEWSIVFCAEGAYVRGFDHESPMSPYAPDNDVPWPGVIDSVPDVFRQFVEQPAFCDEEGTPVVTACLWRQIGDGAWQTGDIDFPERHVDPDGADALFGLLVDRSADAYVRFAEDYYEIAVEPSAVAAVFAQQPLTTRLVAILNPEAPLDDLATDLAEIGCTSAELSLLR